MTTPTPAPSAPAPFRYEIKVGNHPVGYKSKEAARRNAVLYSSNIRDLKTGKLYDNHWNEIAESSKREDEPRAPITTNAISHPCNFCGRPVRLTVSLRFHKCECGVEYRYKNVRPLDKAERLALRAAKAVSA